ncbi:assimilatory sulfite reductase (NADPH) flavoprotein subunit [Staphylococcus debuckii]|uniref:assimilatory sulfite reductase (NADPH) flavoprotein subunit n=1 Tax=Staphylococcus debuckii TaxID=2044912 RepID=UPI000F430E4B|nr:assimilatory sulfite reductase (NADPH) flavoprotein subunit [Staphylococcus debuckii]AYU54045.1 assimilatory sulfite reductase (NADPH) flavoprotein subunit [Staphylococcus debuckii]
MNLSSTNSPFNDEQAQLINQALSTLSNDQKLWLSGYLTANMQGSEAGAVPTPAAGAVQVPETQGAQAAQPQVIEPRKITVLFGSESGNAQWVAELLESKLKENDFDVTLSEMDQYKTKELKKVEDLLIVTSTHGEGDPPDNAISFYDFLYGRKAPNLEGARFSVLALGDQSYEFFCQTGKDFDARLEELGADRILPRVDCDIDFEELANEWIDNIINELGDQEVKQVVQDAQSEPIQNDIAAPVYSRTNPYEAEVLENINITGRGSDKEVRHLELSLEGYGDEYAPGDSINILPENDPALVSELIEMQDWDSEQEIEVDTQGGTMTLSDALTSYFEITKLTKPLLEGAAQIFDNEELMDRLSDNEWVKEYIYGRDLLDLLDDFPTESLQPDQLYQFLRKIPARSYSISSSNQANPDEVHITVCAVRYEAHDRERSGVCSVQLAERVEPGDKLKVYLKKNPNFKFPFDETTPVIMIGPGTGIAPFRAVLQEREELDLTGKTWLFFGNPHFTTDFLYQTEIQEWLDSGVLEKVDLAFSRDQEEKRYVQHLIDENSESFYDWLRNGAAVFVCGDEKNMAKDVHQAIVHVLEKEGGLTEEESENYLAELKKDKRYQRDVY